MTVKTLLGHKSLLTTQTIHRHVQRNLRINESNQFITKITTTKEERINLINDGGEYIKDDGNDWYFRKPK